MMEIADNLTDAVIFGKIMLDKSVWEISYICNFCERIEATFPELFKHALNEHIEDAAGKELDKLCGIETNNDTANTLKKTYTTETNRNDCVEPDDCDLMIQEIMDRQEQEEMDEEILRHFMNKESKSVNDNASNKKDIRTTPIELNESVVGDGSVSDAESEPSNSNFEFFNIAETTNDNPEPKPKRICKVIAMLQCEICKAKFHRPKQLREHKHDEHGESKDAFICKECGKIFSCQTSLSHHKLRHNGVKPHVCSICGKAFITTSEHSLHMRRHTGERPYKCSYCDKDFTCSGALTTHTRTHTKDRPHLCSICGMKLTSAAGLKNHIATHSSERPYKCARCGADFKNEAGLRQHLQTHSMKRKYACQYCKKTFMLSKVMRSHMRSVHKH